MVPEGGRPEPTSLHGLEAEEIALGSVFPANRLGGPVASLAGLARSLSCETPGVVGSVFARLQDLLDRIVDLVVRGHSNHPFGVDWIIPVTYASDTRQSCGDGVFSN